jgi:hypothetical protein
LQKRQYKEQREEGVIQTDAFAVIKEKEGLLCWKNLRGYLRGAMGLFSR